MEKLLEDAGIKLSGVASDIFGVSGRAMMRALNAGERDPQALAQLARPHPAGEDPRAGRGVHRTVGRASRVPVDAIGTDIAALEVKIEQLIAPFADAAARLDAIPGIARTAACVIIAKIGIDMTRFPTAAHLASWARLAPGVNQSAGKSKAAPPAATATALAAVLGEVA